MPAPPHRVDAEPDRETSRAARLADPALLLLAGSAAIADGARIVLTKRETVGGVEAGGWIAATGALLVACTLVQLFGDREPAGEPAIAAKRLASPLAALAMLAAYVLLVDILGYLMSTALFLAVYLRVFGRYRWPAVAAISVPFAVGSAWLWAAMNMLLPQGPLPWP